MTTPTPTAAAMRAARAIAEKGLDNFIFVGDLATFIDTTTGLPELIGALKLAQRWLANCAPVVDLDGLKPLPVIAAALARLEAPQQPVAAPLAQPDPLPRLAHQIWQALPYDHTPGVLMASAANVEAALRRAIPLAQVWIIDAETAPVVQAIAAEEDAGGEAG